MDIIYPLKNNHEETLQLLMHSRSIFNHPIFTLGALAAFMYALICLMFWSMTTTEVLGINAFIKPAKFGVSTSILFLTFSWYSNFIPRVKRKSFQRFVWLNVGVMAFELIWIFIQASRGSLSHFNTSSTFEGVMFALMGIGIATSTSWTLLLFKWTFRSDFRMHPGILWSLRFGILYFVLFGFSGFIMGASLSHTVGSPDGGLSLPILNWFLEYGDLRIPHFLGLHALQLLPLIAHITKMKGLGAIILSLIYGMTCMSLLYVVLQGNSPF